MLKISAGNSKLGRKLPNFSLPPGVTCTPAACRTCWVQGCYAQRVYNQYPNVRNAWDHNYQWILSHGTESFAREMIFWLREKEPAYFRIHVGGDFFSQEYLDSWKVIACAVPRTKFLAFTKVYDGNFWDAPGNFSFIFSTWPGIELPEHWDRIPLAWLEEDERRVEGYHFVCPGKCTEDECDHQCWNTVSSKLPVIFKKH